MINRLEVGQKYPRRFKQEGIILDYNNGFTLFMNLPDLEDNEVNDIKVGEYKFGLTIIDDILFLTCAFGDSIKISDAPFHFALYPDNRGKDLPKAIPDGQGISLNVIAVDSSSSIIKALRLIGLPTEFSRELIRICSWQSKRSIEPNQYNRKLDKIFRNYSSEQLYNMASVKCL